MRNQVYFGRRLAEIEKLMNSGDLLAAERLLRDLGRRPGARKRSLEIARNWRYLKKPLQALRLLHSRVYESVGGRKRLVFRDQESCFEYAASLALAGAAREAQRVLAGIPFEKHPMIARQAYLAASQLWEPERAIEGLHRYRALPGLSKEQYEISRIELADAYLYGLNEPATSWKLLDESEQSIARGYFAPWLGMAHDQIRLQAAYVLRNLVGVREAIRRLRMVSRVDEKNPWVAPEARMYEVLVRAWHVGASERPTLRRELDEVRGAFMRVGRWEFARQCDAYWAIATGDVAALAHAYFSSPLESFRSKLLTWARKGMSATPLALGDSEDLTWPFHRPGRRLRWVIDLESGLVCSRRDGRAAPGPKPPKTERQLPQRILGALASDPYRHATLIELHEAVYPGVPFDPISGAARLHRGLARLREWIGAIPALQHARVEERDGRYSLILPPEVGVRATRTDAVRRPSIRLGELVTRLRKELRGPEFTPAAARAALGVSERTARRALSEAVQEGLLSRTISGPATSYRFVDSPEGKELFP